MLISLFGVLSTPSPSCVSKRDHVAGIIARSPFFGGGAGGGRGGGQGIEHAHIFLNVSAVDPEPEPKPSFPPAQA